MKKQQYVIEQHHHRTPVQKLIAKELGISSEQLLRRQCYHVQEMSMPQSTRHQESLSDNFSVNDLAPSIELNSRNKILQHGLTKCSSREIAVLHFRYGLRRSPTLTLEEIGEILGIKRERVRLIQKEALAKMYGYLWSNRIENIIEC